MTTIYLFPGQGSQHVGMGAKLFEKFPDLVKAADAQLGYSIEKLCLEDPNRQLSQTQYTQPALYVINALTYLERIATPRDKPDFVAGHSLGEYSALFAGGAFDFLTGLKLVQKRGELMGQVSGSSMAAVIGLSADQIRQLLDTHHLSTIDIANLNTSGQTVIAGSREEITAGVDIFGAAGARYVVLNVSAAFHSRYMRETQEQFSQFISGFTFQPPTIPVIANTTALPYRSDQIAETLIQQITAPVRWQESMEFLLQQRDCEFIEVGPGKTLTGLLTTIKSDYQPPPPTVYPPTVKNKIIFMYQGQGSQYYNMGKELYNNNNIFRKYMQNYDDIVRTKIDVSIIHLLYQERSKKFESFDTTLYSHIALFMFGYSLTQVVEDWGIRPACVLGYSLGEYIAATIAGSLNLEQALEAIIQQAYLIETHTPPATIVAVLHSTDILEQHSDTFRSCWVAARNANKQFALTMRDGDVAELTAFFKRRDIIFQQLPIRRGFHSPLIDPAEPHYRQYLQTLTPVAPQIPMISPVSGIVTKMPDADYFWHSIRRCMEFQDTINALEEGDSRNIYLDMGPSGTLAALIKYNMPARSTSVSITTINQFGHDITSLAAAKQRLTQTVQ